MMHNNTTMSCDDRMPCKTYAGLFNQAMVKDHFFYKNIQGRFLQQSARYLGANLNDSKVLSIFSGKAVHDWSNENNNTYI